MPRCIHPLRCAMPFNAWSTGAPSLFGRLETLVLQQFIPGLPQERRLISVRSSGLAVPGCGSGVVIALASRPPYANW